MAFPLPIDKPAACMNQTEFRIGFVEFQLSLQLIWSPDIVIVQDRDIFALRRLKPYIQSPVGPQIGLVEYDAKPRVGLAREPLTSRIRRTIVQGDDLEIPECLILDGLKGIGQKSQVVVASQQDRDLCHRRMMMADSRLQASAQEQGRFSRSQIPIPLGTPFGREFRSGLDLANDRRLHLAGSPRRRRRSSVNSGYPGG